MKTPCGILQRAHSLIKLNFRRKVTLKTDIFVLGVNREDVVVTVSVGLVLVFNVVGCVIVQLAGKLHIGKLRVCL